MYQTDDIEALFSADLDSSNRNGSPLDINLNCLEIVKKVIQEQRHCSPDELLVLSQYQGWGQFASIFETSHPKHDTLRGILNDAEYRALRSTVNTGYFTPDWLVAEIYRAVKKLGFTDAPILDPAAGSGKFVKHRPDALKNNTVHAVDMDIITGHVCRALNPDARVFLGQPFERVNLPSSGEYGLAITNVPFAKVNAQDARYGSISIHNYYLLRMLDEIHQGGFVAVVVSGWVMDSASDKIRSSIASKANLVAACRLPSTVFRDAGAQVVTDILIFQRVEFPEVSPAWLDTVECQGANGASYRLNALYHGKPELVAGTITPPAHMMAANGCEPPAGLLSLVVRGVLDKQTSAAIYKPASSCTFTPTLFQPSLLTLDAGEDSAGVYEYFLSKKGVVCQRLPDSTDDDGEFISVYDICDFRYKSHEQRVRDMLPVKAALKALLDAESDPQRSSECSQLRSNLNFAYDSFTKKHGAFNKKSNRTALKADPWSYRLQAIEQNFNEGVNPKQAAKLGITSTPASWDKAPIFYKRVITPRVTPTHSDYLADAVSHSLNELGTVDASFIARLIKKDKDDVTVMLALGGLAFPVPSQNKMELAALYLSGDVVTKLKEAQAAAAHDPLYQINVLALAEVQPEPIKAIDITAPIYAPWLPLEYRQEFVSELLGEPVETNLLYLDGAYSFALKTGVSQQKLTVTCGTTAKPFAELYELILNNREIKVTVQHPTDKNRRITDVESTLAANQKADEIRERWVDWLMNDAARRAKIEQVFNDTFNVYRPAVYDGSYLELPSSTTSLYSHQKNAIARATMSQATLLDHEVGAGKSWTIAGIVMEHRRLYPSTRAMVAMPNHLVAQFSCSFSAMYPAANVITLDPKVMSKQYRRETLSRLMVTDFDVCIIPESAFAMIPPPIESEKSLIQAEIDEVEFAISAMEDAKFSIRRLEAKLQNLKSKLHNLSLRGKDNMIRFDELGINMLITDEAHSWKNLYIHTQMSNVGGLGNLEGSKKAFDLYCKSHYMHSIGGKLVFATGTTLLNSPTEVFTWLRYMIPFLIKEKGLAHFDAFASLFAQPESDWELSPASSGYIMRTRLRKFTNLTELMKIYHLFADVVTESDLKDTIPNLPDGRPAIPMLKNGTVTKVIIEPDNAQIEGFESIIERYKSIDRKKNNALALINEGRNLGLDARLVYPYAPDHADNRISHVATNVLDKYREFDSDKATQLVFIDRSIPAKHRAGMRKELLTLLAEAEAGCSKAEQQLAGLDNSEIEALTSMQFSLYDDLKQKLVAQGIPEGEIAFIHDYRTDAKKDELRALINAGRIRVLIGSTQLMGSGLNVNERLCALHHVDAPLRPGDMVQRDGRIKRQGNKLWQASDQFYIEIFVYTTARTLDAWLWQLLENKSRFITLFRKGDYSVRNYTEDKEEIAFDELKALVSDNPLILEHVKASAKLKKLSMLERQFKVQQHRIEDDLTFYQKQLDTLKARLPRLEEDAQFAQQQNFSGFWFESDDGTFTDKGFYGARTDAGEPANGTTALGVAITRCGVQAGDWAEIGKIHGLPVVVRPTSNMFSGLGVDVYVKGRAMHPVDPHRPTFASLANMLEKVVCQEMGEAATNAKALIKRRESDVATLTQAKQTGFKYQSEIANCRMEVARLERELAQVQKDAA